MKLPVLPADSDAVTTACAGDWVEVRSKEEILRTLDENGRFEGLPFMPEMFEYCGQRFQVWKRAHKTCDTVNYQGGRRMTNAVHLAELRCDGKAHGGCQAACLLFWKNAWLRSVRGPAEAAATTNAAELSKASAAPDAGGCSEQTVWDRARGAELDGEPVYSCQATELLNATVPLRTSELSQYVEDYRSKNVGLRQIVDGFVYLLARKLVDIAHRLSARVGAFFMRLYDRIQRLRGGVPYPRKSGSVPPNRRTPSGDWGMRPGDWVRVKSYDEILLTLDAHNKNRGLYFDAEHVPFCGGRYRVLRRVDTIIDEKTGKILKMKGGCIVLEGVWCQARYSDSGRMFCPRAVYPYWREIWLELDEREALPAKGSEALPERSL